ncbi:MAG: ATP-dependent protease [Anaerolineae bacterium SG8_19]|nr:MAG: ATP-dependent protease [Anaerolineae bacterium SG8_19]
MTVLQPLSPEQLCRHCDPAQFSFETTAALEDLEGLIGQTRAVEAVQFGIGIRREGYNLYVLGPHGTGKHTAVRQFLEQKAATEPTPADWCYVNNFEQPHKPDVLKLPPGQGAELRGDMEWLVQELRTAIPAAFEKDDYRAQKQALQEEFAEQQELAFKALQHRAEASQLAVIRTSSGLAFAPVKGDRVLKTEEFQTLPKEEQERIEEAIGQLQAYLEETIRQVQQWEREHRDKMKRLDREVAKFAVDQPLDELREKYRELPEVAAYLDAVEADIIESADDFRQKEEVESPALAGIPLPRALQGPPPFRRYQVNLLVDRIGATGTPVLYQDHPTYQNLIGRVEHIMAQMGTVMTDFTLIKGGAFHQANGGYLMLDAHKVLAQPYAWEALKRALRADEICIESVGQLYGMVSTIALEPEPIPLDIKIVLLGDRMLYYLLCEYDPDFNELFKVVVDFEEEMDRSPENNMLYARLIGTLARKEELRHFDRSAVARVIDHSARIVEDSEKLSTRMQGIADLLREADYWAGEAGHQVVTAADVQQAIEAQIYRASRIRERAYEAIERGTILIDTTGARVGQVNGLSVISLGQFSFGRPSRITATVRLGRGKVVDIEREVELGGPLHSKGVLILSGFLSARYVPNQPLSLAASLVFEQSYSGVDGDSASSAELYALLSALAEVPLKQSLAVTGSVNQYGQVQAIGGVNEKVEGFFDVCRAGGLTGEQGVLIPAANVIHLMLRPDVVETVEAGQFHIFAVETIDQGLEILTGLPAGERDEQGNFPEGSLNRQVETRLAAMAERWQALSGANGSE